MAFDDAQATPSERSGVVSDNSVPEASRGVPDSPVQPSIKPIKPLSQLKTTLPNDDKMLCERCGADMYRMHAVWRCTNCGYKTDCCGW